MEEADEGEEISVKQEDLKTLLFMAKANGGRLLGSVSWKVVRELVLFRDGHECKLCGKKSELHIHHTDYPDWDLDKLVTLCADCHMSQPKRRRRKISDVKSLIEAGMSLRTYDQYLQSLKELNKLPSPLEALR